MGQGLFLGVDGGGTKTEFVLIDRAGRVAGRHQGGASYYLQVGFDGLNRVLADGVAAVIGQADAGPGDIIYAFFGLPAYGEDSEVRPLLDVMPEAVLGHRRYHCGNDMVCGWAGSLASRDGINIVAGTGSIGYGEYRGRNARAGGWGEVFSDEGSAYWIAVQGLNAFTRMSDGRRARGPLHDIFRAHFELADDLDVCGRVMGQGTPSRDAIAALSQLVSRAAEAGDPAALGIFETAGAELAAMVEAIRAAVGIPGAETTAVSYSGGVFNSGKLILEPFSRALTRFDAQYRLQAPLLPPGLGAALYAARCAGEPLPADAIQSLSAVAAS